MKHVVESVEALYHAREPTGEVVVDAVVDVLRKYKMIYPEDVALIMDVDLRELRAAWHLLTGTRLIDVITQWRFMQAQDLIRRRLNEQSSGNNVNQDSKALLAEVARRCGWRSERVMSHVFERYCRCSALEWLAQQQKN